MSSHQFQPTRWTLIAKLESGPKTSNRALNELCAIYWNPLYVFARSAGKSREDAEDAVQGFLAKGADKALFAMADKDRGKMRNFLLTAFKRYMRDEWSKQVATKRGSGNVIAMDFSAEEYHFSHEATSDPTQGFDKRWALMLIEQTKKKLEQRYLEEGKIDFYHTISDSLTGELNQSYAEIATEHNTSVSNVKVAVHRLRKRFGDVLREEIRETVSCDTEVDEELKHLISLLG